MAKRKDDYVVCQGIGSAWIAVCRGSTWTTRQHQDSGSASLPAILTASSFQSSITLIVPLSPEICHQSADHVEILVRLGLPLMFDEF